jgi:hemolysin III
MRVQTLIEERYNYRTHALGLILAVLAFILLLSAPNVDTSKAYFAVSLYGLSLCILYFISSKYHHTKEPRKKLFYRKLDHISIYILIAGTYSPMTLLFLSHSKGLVLFYTVWAIALFGTLLKIFFTGRFEIISLLLYVIMGWLIVFDFSALQEVVSNASVYLLMAGGLAYTGGIVFYVWDALQYNHVIWHLFVLTGSICHFFCIYLALI